MASIIIVLVIAAVLLTLVLVVLRFVREITTMDPIDQEDDRNIHEVTTRRLTRSLPDPRPPAVPALPMPGAPMPGAKQVVRPDPDPDPTPLVVPALDGAPGADSQRGNRADPGLYSK